MNWDFQPYVSQMAAPFIFVPNTDIFGLQWDLSATPLSQELFHIFLLSEALQKNSHHISLYI